MGQIQVLAPEVALRIAAGEVVDRPAAVVKELIENALDAAATRIVVQMEEGGVSSLAVQDDGEGMDPADAALAFVRHATSKIRTAQDLQTHTELGFRGEALASIAAVAKVTLTTCAKGAAAGTRCILEGGKLLSTEAVAWPQGTAVQVGQLFYNTPARLRHLGTVATEATHVLEIVQRLALAQPKVSMALFHGQRQLLHTVGDGSLLHAFHAVVGAEAARQAIPFAAQTPEWKIDGLVTHPGCHRASRKGIVWVINGRCVRSQAFSQALVRGYESLLPKGRYPLAVVHVHLDPQWVDLNVHPSKQTLRLRREEALADVITQAVHRAWQREGAQQIPRPVLAGTQRPVGPRGAQLSTTGTASLAREQPKQQQLWGGGSQRKAAFAPASPVRTLPEPQPAAGSPVVPSQPAATEPEVAPTAWPTLRVVGQIHATYLVAEGEDGMYLLDQHAAHERVHYERLCTFLAEHPLASQTLVVPLTLELSRAEALRLQALLPELEGLGVEVEPFGESAFLIRSYPALLAQGSGDVKAILTDWLTAVLAAGAKESKREWLILLAQKWSCRASIRADHRLQPAEMEALLAQWSACKEPATCPHGRPVVVRITTDALDKLFRRGR